MFLQIHCDKRNKTIWNWYEFQIFHFLFVSFHWLLLLLMSLTYIITIAVYLWNLGNLIRLACLLSTTNILLPSIFIAVVGMWFWKKREEKPNVRCLRSFVYVAVAANIQLFIVCIKFIRWICVTWYHYGTVSILVFKVRKHFKTVYSSLHSDSFKVTLKRLTEPAKLWVLRYSATIKFYATEAKLNTWQYTIRFVHTHYHY